MNVPEDQGQKDISFCKSRADENILRQCLIVSDVDSQQFSVTGKSHQPKRPIMARGKVQISTYIILKRLSALFSQQRMYIIEKPASKSIMTKYHHPPIDYSEMIDGSYLERIGGH